MTINLEQFKGEISGKSGPARSNLFMVELPAFPGATIRSIYLVVRLSRTIKKLAQKEKRLLTALYMMMSVCLFCF